MLGHWAQGKNDDVASARQVAGPDQHTHLLVFLYPGLNAGAVVMKERANPRTASHFFSLPNTTVCHTPFEMAFELSGASITFIDTPRLAWKPSLLKKRRPNEACVPVLRMPFCATKSRIDHLKDPIPSVSCKAPRAGTEYLVVFYDLPGTSIDAFLMGVAAVART